MDRRTSSQVPQSNRAREPGKPPSLSRTVLQYGIGIALCIVLAFVVGGFVPSLDLLSVVLLSAGIALIPALVGAIFRNRGRMVVATVLGSYAAQSVFTGLFLLGLQTLPYVPAQFAPAVPPLFVFVNATLLWRLGGILTRATCVPPGMCASRLGTAFALFLIFQLLAFEAVWSGYSFLYAAIAYGGLSISPILAFSPRFSSFNESGRYLLRSTNKWTLAAFAVGIAATILSYPGANIYTYVVVLVLAAIVLSYLGFRIYSLGSSRLRAIQDELYRKHAHEVNLVSDESFDYLRAAMVEFVKGGSKSNLLIALTNLLTNVGMDYALIKNELTPLSAYEVPEVFKLSYLSLSKSLELEMQKRIGILQLLMQTISAEASASGKN